MKRPKYPLGSAKNLLYVPTEALPRIYIHASMVVEDMVMYFPYLPLLTIRRNDLGMARCYDRDTVRSHEHGGTVQLYANQWRTLLRCCCASTTWMGSICRLDHRME